MKAIRGAIAVVANEADKIGAAAQRLVSQTCTANGISADDIIMLLFTCTQDLTAAYPAQAVRATGFAQVPMLCFQEMQVDSSLQGCIRIMILVRRELPAVRHIYLGEAKKLRPDWVGD